MIDFVLESEAYEAASGGAPRNAAAPEEAMIRTHWAAVRRFLRLLGADGPTADDLAQDVFVVALRKGVATREPEAASGFLRATARNLFRASRRRRRSVPLEDLEQVWSEEERDVDRRRDALRRCQGRLTDRVQQALRLAYGERRSRAEVAQALGILPGGVKSMIRRAHRKLRECVERTLANERRPS